MILVFGAKKIDAEMIATKIALDPDVTLQVLDNLLMLEAIPLDLYKCRVKMLIEKTKNDITIMQNQLKAAEEQGEKYNPAIYYAVGRYDFGAGIENALNNV